MTSVISGMTVTGNLTTDCEGNILQTGGSLQNNEKLGQILHKMLTCVPALTNNLPGPPQFNKITLSYPDSVVMATATGDKVHVVKFAEK